MHSVGRSINDTYAPGGEVWCRAQWKSLKGSSSGLSASLVNQDPHEKKTRAEKDPRVFHSGNRARVNHARASAGGFMYMAKCEVQRKNARRFLERISHGPNIYKGHKPLMSAFLKNWAVKALGGRCWSVWGPISPPPSRYRQYEYIPLYLFTQGRGEEG